MKDVKKFTDSSFGGNEEFRALEWCAHSPHCIADLTGQVMDELDEYFSTRGGNIYIWAARAARRYCPPDAWRGGGASHNHSALAGDGQVYAGACACQGADARVRSHE